LEAYRPEHVRKRILVALEQERLSSPAALVRLLGGDEQARSRFRRAIAISVSGLFRDEAQFELLERTLLPPLLAKRRRISVWSAGCADGSELYSVAIVLERLGALERALLLGSDILEENLAAARHGVYGPVEIPARIRAAARWERRDLLAADMPPSGWTLVLCRNVAIYLGPRERAGLYEKLAASLARGGILLLGRAERMAAPASLGLELVAPHAYTRTG